MEWMLFIIVAPICLYYSIRWLANQFKEAIKKLSRLLSVTKYEDGADWIKRQQQAELERRRLAASINEAELAAIRKSAQSTAAIEKLACERTQTYNKAKDTASPPNSEQENICEVKEKCSQPATVEKNDTTISAPTSPLSTPIFIHKPDSQIVKAFKHNGVSSLWHMTHISNLHSIIETGILNHSDAHQHTFAKDISNRSVNDRRERIEPLFRRRIHDYAPLYINVRNPMLYVKKDIREDLCLLEISLSVLDQHPYIYTDGNAAANATRFFNQVDDVEKLPWDVLNANYWNDKPDGKRKRCAEVLIYNKIESKFIKKIHCHSAIAANHLARSNINVTVSKQLFF